MCTNMHTLLARHILHFGKCNPLFGIMKCFINCIYVMISASGHKSEVNYPVWIRTVPENVVNSATQNQIRDLLICLGFRFSWSERNGLD